MIIRVIFMHNSYFESENRSALEYIYDIVKRHAKEQMNIPNRVKLSYLRYI